MSLELVCAVTWQDSVVSLLLCVFGENDKLLLQLITTVISLNT